MQIKTLGSLFSGIGGLEKGIEEILKCETVWQVEKDARCRTILERHWPDADRYVIDVRRAGRKNLDSVDLLCGGFPCQNLSSAGKREGLTGPLSQLWFEFRRIAEEISPSWIVVENVASGKRRWVPYVRRDLHLLGYRTRAYQLSAFDCGAPHRRERVFILASDSKRVELRNESGWRGGTNGQTPPKSSDHGQERSSANADPKGELQSKGSIPCFWKWTRGGDRWTIEPSVSGVAHGIRRRLHREHQLGNAVSPEQSRVIGRLIKSFLE